MALDSPFMLLEDRPEQLFLESGYKRCGEPVSVVGRARISKPLPSPASCLERCCGVCVMAIVYIPSSSRDRLVTGARRRGYRSSRRPPLPPQEPRSRQNPLRSCKFRPTSVAAEPADSVGQLGPIPVTEKVEIIQKETQFEQSRALPACELKRGGQGAAALLRIHESVRS